MNVSSIKFLFTRSFVIFTAFLCFILASATVKAANTRVKLEAANNRMKVVRTSRLLKSYLKTKALQHQKFDPTVLLNSIKPEAINKFVTTILGMKAKDLDIVKSLLPLFMKILKGDKIREIDMKDLRNISTKAADTVKVFDKAVPMVQEFAIYLQTVSPTRTVEIFKKAIPILTELGQSLGDLKENDLKIVKAFMPVVIKLLNGKEINRKDLNLLKKAKLVRIKIF